MDRIDRAMALAAGLADGDRLPLPPPAVAIRRTVAVGDPQARAGKLFAVLEHHGLLGDDGRLRDDVQLVSIGDHFDFGTRAQGTIDEARVDGPRFLRWLCAHPPEQVAILIGNHDTARVMELAGAGDARFDAAALLADQLLAEKNTDPERFAARVCDEYAAAFPELPAPNVVHRDFSAFTEAQRALVQRELLAGRLRLAATARLPGGGGELLLTHAGVTARELALLGLPDEREPAPLAAALERRLHDAIEAVREPWTRGAPAALTLVPLHVACATAADGLDGLPEGGGMLFHRPSDPDRPGADRSWEHELVRPRRYHPRTLPAGLAQVAGHTGHPKCVAELERWRDPAMRETLSGRRTLCVRGDDIHYQLGVVPPAAGDAVLYMIDPSMHRAPDPAAIELFELEPGSLR